VKLSGRRELFGLLRTVMCQRAQARVREVILTVYSDCADCGKSGLSAIEEVSGVHALAGQKGMKKTAKNWEKMDPVLR